MTTFDGLLPITNFTEEINEVQLRKKGKGADKGKEVGEISEFSSEDLSKNLQKNFANGNYVYLPAR